jgi:type IV fimbrial biogenesis protein FimT
MSALKARNLLTLKQKPAGPFEDKERNVQAFMTSHKKCSGVTAIELLVVVVIIAIFATFAIPAFSVWLPNYRLRTASRDLLSNLQRAKLTAIKRNSLCTVTFNQTVGGINYAYVAYMDADGDLEYDAGEEIVARVLLEDYGNVNFSGFTLTNNDDGLPSIAFRSNGLTLDNAGNYGSGAVSFTNTKGNTSQVSISLAGSVSIT